MLELPLHSSASDRDPGGDVPPAYIDEEVLPVFPPAATAAVWVPNPPPSLLADAKSPTPEVDQSVPSHSSVSAVLEPLYPPKDNAADIVPANFGPPAHDMNMRIEEEFAPEGISTFSTDVGNNYENLKTFITSQRGTKEYDQEVAFFRKLFDIKK